MTCPLAVREQHGGGAKLHPWLAIILAEALHLVVRLVDCGDVVDWRRHHRKREWHGDRRVSRLDAMFVLVSDVVVGEDVSVLEQYAAAVPEGARDLENRILNLLDRARIVAVANLQVRVERVTNLVA